jgi:hypothetical protein
MPGISEFFFIDKTTAEYWEIEREYLHPVIDSVKDINSYFVTPESLEKYIFLCNLETKELKKSGALSYIKYGEMQKNKTGVLWPDVPSVKGRRLWYGLGSNVVYRGDLISQNLLRERFYFIEPAEAIASKHFFIIKFNDRSQKDLLIALMNCTFTYFQCEIFGRTNQTGIINIYKPELNQLLIPDPSAIAPVMRDQIIDAYRQLRNCGVPKILDELGFNGDTLSCSPNPLRKNMDLLIYQALGYSESDLRQMYLEFALLVESRKTKELNS